MKNKSHDVKYSVKWWSVAEYEAYKKTNKELGSGPWIVLWKRGSYRYSFISHSVNPNQIPPLLNQSWSLYLFKNISQEDSFALKGARKKKKRLKVTVTYSKLYPRTHATIKLVQLLKTGFTANWSLKVFWSMHHLKLNLRDTSLGILYGKSGHLITNLLNVFHKWKH